MSVLRAHLIDKTLIALACMKTLKIFLKLCDLNLKKLLVFRTSFYISFVLMSVWVLAYIMGRPTTALRPAGVMSSRSRRLLI